MVLTATALRQDHDISFFDSHYAATAILLDEKIISTDRIYHSIPGLIVFDPESLVNESGAGHNSMPKG